AARAAIISIPIIRPLVQIWANLNEQIILLDEADIWIAPGVTLDRTAATPTIIDNVSGTYTDPVDCKIYGYGKIKNSYINISNPNDRFECIKTINPNTKLEVRCDSISGTGGLTSSQIIAPSIYIVNGKKFHLKCNTVINNKTCGIALGFRPNAVQYHIDDVNLRVQKIEIDSDVVTNSESIAISTLATGFINVDEIICRHYGHCLLHAQGKIIATIRKMSVINNINFGGGIVRVDHGGSSASQTLTLYFDEILALQTGIIPSGTGFAIAQAKAMLIGRRIYSKNNYAVQMNGGTTTISGSIKCNEIISETNVTFEIGEKVNQVLIDSNIIEGFSSSESGLVFSKGSAKYVIRNARMRNYNTASGSRGISLFLFDSVYPNVSLWNVKIILDNSSANYVVYANGTPSTDVSVYNYGLFGNKNYDTNNIDLKIGYEGSAGGYLFIEDINLA
ncbi:MAG: hypothetical protein ABIY50_08815, partial [Ignavibacteria bacterium]